MSKDIYVFIEQRDDVIQKVGLELIGEATKLADELDQKVVAVLLGSGIKTKTATLLYHGADEVIYVDDPILRHYLTEPYAKAITQIINQCEPEIFLFGATTIGRDLAPRVAGRVHTGLTADCTSLAINPENGLLLMTRPAFGGNIMATIVCQKHRPQMATVRQGVMHALESDSTRNGVMKVIDVEFKPEDVNVEIMEIVKEKHAVADITEAKVVVACGRGIGNPECINIVRDLADVLDGNIAASRPIVDDGWLKKDYQVGQTGKTVRPDLYIACGISGAIQHTSGMEDSEYIIAINKDDEAAIFDLADLGIVGDIHAILPKLTEAIQNKKIENEAI